VGQASTTTSFVVRYLFLQQIISNKRYAKLGKEIKFRQFLHLSYDESVLVVKYQLVIDFVTSYEL
jgi:hypothetical protein